MKDDVTIYIRKENSCHQACHIAALVVKGSISHFSFFEIFQFESSDVKIIRFTERAAQLIVSMKLIWKD